MKRSGDVKWGQVQIGAVVFVAVGFLLWAAMKGGDLTAFAGKKSLRANFTDVKGLVVGAPVKLNGYEVGEVAEISFDHFLQDRRIEVRANVNNSAWRFIRRDSGAGIAAIG